MLADTPLPRGSGANLAVVGTLSEASDGLLPPRLYLVGYVRWDARSDHLLVRQSCSAAYRSHCAMSVRVFSTPAQNASVRALVRVSRPAWLILPFASSQIKYSVSIRMTPGSSTLPLIGELVNKFGRGAPMGSVVRYDVMRFVCHLPRRCRPTQGGDRARTVH